MTHTFHRRALAAAATALLALAPSALAAHRAPQPGPLTNYPSAVAAQPGALSGTHAQTPSDIDPAWDANVGAYTPGSSRAVSYPSRARRLTSREKGASK
jgi:hypothetical protein